MQIENVHESEVEDFLSELRRRGRSAEEFEVLATPQKPASQQHGVISAVGGSIKIRNKKTGIERTYSTGFGSSWVADFSEDLRLQII